LGRQSKSAWTGKCIDLLEVLRTNGYLVADEHDGHSYTVQENAQITVGEEQMDNALFPRQDEENASTSLNQK
jgi:hypothetical protein